MWQVFPDHILHPKHSELQLQMECVVYHRPSRHGQITDPVQLKLCLSHKRRLASNADIGFYCVNIMTTSFSPPERIVWTIMSGIITVTRLMSSLGIKDHWVKWIYFYLWFIHTLYAKRTRWNYMYIYFIAKKRKFLKVDRGIYFKSCVLKLTDIRLKKKTSLFPVGRAHFVSP